MQRYQVNQFMASAFLTATFSFPFVFFYLGKYINSSTDHLCDYTILITNHIGCLFDLVVGHSPHGLKRNNNMYTGRKQPPKVCIFAASKKTNELFHKQKFLTGYVYTCNKEMQPEEKQVAFLICKTFPL